MAKLFCFGLADREYDLAGVVIGLGNDTRIHVLDNTHDIVHLWIGERILHQFLHLTGFNSGMRNGISRCLTIGYDKTTGPQVHTPIVAHHHDEDIREFIGIDLSEDGFTGC